MATNDNSPESSPLNDQVPVDPRLGNQILFRLPEQLLQQEMTPSPVAPDEINDNFLGLYYRVDVEALKDWATVTHFMKGSIRFVAQKPEVTDDFTQFLIIMYSSSWEKRC